MQQKPLPLFESLAALFGIAVVSILVALPSVLSSPESAEDNPAIELSHHLQQLRSGLEQYLAAGGDTKISGEELEQALRAHLVAIPSNPINGKATIRVMPAGFTEIRANGTAGWVYLPADATIHPDSNGVDAQGIPYTSY